MAAARGIAKERCDMVGRWSGGRQKGSNSGRDYVQTEADIVTNVRLEVMAGWATLDEWYAEADLYSRLEEVAKRRHIPDDVTSKALKGNQVRAPCIPIQRRRHSRM